MTPREIHEYAIKLAVEAGADPVRARERMAQLAQVVVGLLEEATPRKPMARRTGAGRGQK